MASVVDAGQQYIIRWLANLWRNGYYGIDRQKPEAGGRLFSLEKQNSAEGTFNNTYSLSSQDFSQQFHVFSLLWSHDSLQILVDNVPYVKASRKDLTNGIYPFDHPFFLLFNVAVGGDWPGPPNASTKFPQRMYVDYVRVFQQD